MVIKVKRRSLDDTCDIFLTRRRVRSPPITQRAISESTHYTPTLRPENMTIPYICVPKPPILSAPSSASSHSTKQLPLPGSSGSTQPKPVRLPNGRCHIPRPRNPFILFRCDLVHQRKVLPRSDLDDTNISRIAGDLWREMTPAQKKPWVDLAAQEKTRHALLYPDYKYAPGHTSAKIKKARIDHAYVDNRTSRSVGRMGDASPTEYPSVRRQQDRLWPYPRSIPRRRSSSCPPPGSIKAHHPIEVCTPSLVPRDDIQRSPSRTVMYHSRTPPSAVEPTTPVVPPGHDPMLATQGWLGTGSSQISPLQLDISCPLPDLSQHEDQEAYAAASYAFLEYKPMFPLDVGSAGLTADELKELEQFAMEATFTDPFAPLGNFLMNQVVE